MAYASSDQVRQVLASESPLADAVTDQPIILTGTGFIKFFGGPVLEGSVRVKAVQQTRQTRIGVTFVSDVVTLTNVPLVSGSLVIASDSSLGVIYLENSDYTIDYPAAQVTRRAGSAVAEGQGVAVWYLPYHVYDATDDYELNLTAGEIRRVNGGAIGSGQMVYLDYRPQQPRLTDLMIEAAVHEANALVEREVDPAREFGTDPVLAAAATSLAIEIVCRGAACRELAAGQRDDRAAVTWLKLSSEYAGRAERLLRSFRPPVTGPAFPAIS